MISEEKYIELIENVLGITVEDNLNQKEAILSSLDEDQYIVAGPGSGKTTVLVLKILKYVFVDGLNFENIIVTTFTKKAAKEIKERIVNWHYLLCKQLNIDESLNLNNFLIGTLDSIAEELISDYVDVEVIDNFTASAIMMQNLLTDERNNDKKLKQFTKNLRGNMGGVSTSEINNLIQTIKERIYYDLLDFDLLRRNAGREQILYDILDDYINQLESRNVMDYAMLENKFYEILSTNTIERLNNISVLLIDEYQDTNLLQEGIYFKITEYVKKNNGNITVVGDDDQSLYRFRGATISLFTNYVKRISSKLNVSPKTIFLEVNYRSTKAVIDFTNDFIHLDDKYQMSRTTNKPYISTSNTTENGLPIMGMFRNNIEELSTDLSNLIYDLKLGNDYIVDRNGIKYNISTKNTNPSIAVLLNSPKEISAFNKKRLPFYIRETLSYKDENIGVFNPRGQSIETTDIVSLICGLILLSIDPNSTTEKQLDNLPPHTKNSLKTWRNYAQEYIETVNKKLPTYYDEINLNMLLEDIHEECSILLEESNENVIYHDIIMETISQTNNAINNDGFLSVNQVFWHILVPIASGAIEIDDDMFDVSLEENINIMSIHQSKGLEFDVVIVDVGSDIVNNNPGMAFKRFPKNGGITYNLEKYLKITNEEDNISGLDKAFNDLIRKYFVAYTRAKSILILVGLNSMRYGYKGDFQDKIEIPNIATGWTRDKVWHWDSLDNLFSI
ncbi:MAG: ATP-dependent helicase [Methanosphaera sp.]|nr:ATP-dependent helicase [Methanosphaera sp.]